MGSTAGQSSPPLAAPAQRSGVRCAREFKIASAACTSILYHICYDPMNTPVREGETIEMSRTMRNRPYRVAVLKCSQNPESRAIVPNTR